MKFAVAALLGLAAAESDILTAEDYKFMEFVSKHGRSYGTVAEYNFRKDIFKQRIAEHERHNSQAGVTSFQGVNFLTDRTDEEIKKMNGFKASEQPAKVGHFNTTNLASGIDWRQKGAVTPVKNQGQCGSCWSFSTTGALEGAHFVKTGQLTSLSEQQLVDCSWLNHGCNGGSMDLAFMYTEKTKLETEANYPYTAKSGLFKCKADKSKEVVGATTYVDVPKNSSAALKAALNKGPVSVAIEADKPVFHQYTGGVITGSSCGTGLDHGVLAVGYGSENGQDFYIVKNSWTTQWGEQGYVRIGIEDGAGVCGIQMMASQPTTN
jgi:C1A family cysteine protease